MRLVIERRVELSEVMDDKGTTRYKQLTDLKRTTGIVDPLLEEVEVPPAGQWILEQYLCLADRREIGEMGGYEKPISEQQIWYFCQNRNMKFSKFDLLAIHEMDNAYLRMSYNLREKKNE